MTINVKNIGQSVTTAGSGYVAGEIVNLAMPSKPVSYVASEKATLDPFNPAITRMIYANSLYVAVGDNGLITTSPDARVWTASTGIDTKMHFTGVAYGNSIFVAVTRKCYMMTSTDGITWAEMPPSIHSYVDVAFGNGVFVALNAVGESFVSADGLTWVAYVASANVRFNSIIYANSQFVAAGNGGKVYKSTDGITWTSASTDATIDIQSLTYFGSNFYVTGFSNVDGSGLIYSTPDLATWTLVNTTTSVQFYGINASSTTLLVVGSAGKMYKSTNGTTWTLVTSSLTKDLNTVAVNGTTYVVAGAGSTISIGNSSLVFTNRRTNADLANLKKVYQALNGRLVAIDSNGYVVTSADGITWTGIDDANPGTGQDFAVGAGVMVVVGAAGSIKSSTDGITWTSRASGVSVSLNAITYANSRFVAVGANNTIITSTDGITWSNFDTGVNAFLDYAIAVNGSNSVYIGLGHGVVSTNVDCMHRSTDGVNWVPYDANTGTNGLRAIASNILSSSATSFVAVGDNGSIVSSIDGIVWTPRTSGVSTNLKLVIYAGNWIAAGEQGVVLTSTDGITWTSRTSGVSDSTANVSTMTSIQSRIAITGTIAATPETYVLVSSDNGVTWTKNTLSGGNGKVIRGLSSQSFSTTATWLLVGDQGYMATTADRGVTWAYPSSGTTNRLNAVAWLGSANNSVGSFVVVGDAGTIRASSNTTSWTAITAPTGPGSVVLDFTDVYGPNASNGMVLANSTTNCYSATLVGATTNFTVSSVTAVASGFLGGKLKNLSGGTTNYFIVTTAGGTTFGQIPTTIPPISTTPTWFFGVSKADQTITLTSVAYGNMIWAVVGNSGYVRSSINGDLFLPRFRSVATTINNIKYTTQFVGVGAAGYVTLTADTKTWSDQTSGSGHTINDFIYANSAYMAVGNNGTILTSPDAVTWTARNGGITHDYPNTAVLSANLNSLVLYGTRYVVVGDNSTVTTSTNGTSFEYNVLNARTMRGMTATGGFIAMTNANYPMTSVDGITWDRSTTLYLPTANDYAYSNTLGLMVAVGNSGVIYTSADGVTWTLRTSGVSTNLNEITWGPSGFAVAGDNAVILYSADGITWTLGGVAVSSNKFVSVVYASSKYVAVGNGFTSYSSDGTTWTNVIDGYNYSNLVLLTANGTTYFYASTIDGKVRRSTDGTTWTSCATNTTVQITSGAYFPDTTVSGQGVFVLTGKAGKLLTSPDGIVFTVRNISMTRDLNGIIYTAPTFVMVGSGGYIGTSTNLVDWTTRTTSTGQDLNGIALATNYIAVGNNGTILTSPDAVTWTARTSGVSTNLNFVSASAAAAVGDNGVILTTSNSGVSWTARTSGVTANLYGIVWQSSTFVAVGDQGTILKSTNAAVTWTPAASVGVINWKNIVYSTTNAQYQVKGVSTTSVTRYMTSPDTVTWTNKSSLTLDTEYMIGFASSVVYLKFDAYGRWMTYIPEIGINAKVLTVDGSGGILTLATQTGAVSSNYSSLISSLSTIIPASTASSVTGLAVGQTTMSNRFEGRVRRLLMSSPSNTYSTISAPSTYQGQFGFRIYDTDATGSRVLVANAGSPNTTVTNNRAVGDKSLNTNLESIPGGNGFGRVVSHSTYPKKQDTSLTYASVTTNLVNVSTGAIEFTFPYSYAKMSSDGNEVACTKNNGPSDTELAFYVKISGVWTKTWSATVTALITDMDFAVSSKDKIVINSINGIKVFKRDAGLNTFTDQGYMIGTGYIDYAWTRASDSTSFTHGVVLARSGYSPYGDVHVSSDGTKVAAMAMAHKKTGGSYATLDADNFSPYPIIYDISTSTATVYRPTWLDWPAVQVAKTLRFSSTNVFPTANFYNEDISCYSWDIKADFSTIMFASKPNSAGSGTLLINITDRPSGVGSNTGMTAATHQSNLLTDTYYPIRVCPTGTRYAVGGMTRDYKGWIRVQGVLSEATTFSNTTATNNNRRYGYALTFAKDGSALFAGDPSYNHVTAGTSAITSYAWSVYSFVPEGRGTNINSVTIGFSGGDALSQCPNITMAGVGDQQKMTSYWPYFTAGGGGVYMNPATISITVISIS